MRLHHGPQSNHLLESNIGALLEHVHTSVSMTFEQIQSNRETDSPETGTRWIYEPGTSA